MTRHLTSLQYRQQANNSFKPRPFTAVEMALRLHHCRGRKSVRLNSGVRPCKSIFHPYNVQMIKFDWDPAKAASNLRKHGVSFEEAQTVFYDELAVQFYDEPHSSDEERFLMLGMSSGAHLLLVCHCERDSGGVIRIISARKATKQESSFYSQ